jgi:hypothetical protein
MTSDELYLAMAGDGWRWLAMAGDGWRWLAMAGDARMACDDLRCFEMTSDQF